MTDKLVPTTYNQLKAQITEIVASGRERARQAVVESVRNGVRRRSSVKDKACRVR